MAGLEIIKMVIGKNLSSYIVIISAFFMFADMACAQNLLLLSKEKRDSTLIVIAKKVCLKHAPEFYREYGESEITQEAVRNVDSFAYRKSPNVKIGDMYYSVKFRYNKQKEEMEEDYAFDVTVWARSSKPFAIYLGNSYIKVLKNDEW